MNHTKLRCTCHDAIGLNITGMHCPQHSDVVSSTVAGRVHQGEAHLRPVGAGTREWLEDQERTPPTLTRTRASTAPCSCDAPMIFGHDTGCEYHPAPILSDPLQLLLAAVQLISDQPTTEQWHTIKKAIADLVPSPFRSA